MERVSAVARRALAMFDALERREKIMAGLGLGFLLTMMTLLGVFHEPVLRWMAAFSTDFRKIPLGWMILFLLYVLISFPPMIGYSALSAFTGMVYGFPGGWPLLAAGTLVGSFLSFVTFRYLLMERATQLAHSNIKFMAFAKTLEQDSFMLLWMIRLCPLPYSLSNAAMSSVPTVEPWKFFLATACTTPKLFLHIFIGSRLARLSDSKDNGTWWANFISVVIAVTVGIVTSWLIYKRTMARAAALEAQHQQGNYGTLQGEVDDIEDVEDFEIEDDDAVETGENPFSNTHDV